MIQDAASFNCTNLVKVMIADDHPLVRQALKTLFENHSDFKLIAEASDGEEAVDLALKYLPDVVIMDITMPKLNGLDATRRIKAQCPNIKILVLTVHSDSEHIIGILEAGAAGYLVKNVFGEEVINSLRAVMAGENVLSNPALHQMLKTLAERSICIQENTTDERFSTRELAILKLTAKGMSNKEIALSLNLGLQTVKGYAVTLFSKLGVGSRTEAVIKGLRSGIITPRDIE